MDATARRPTTRSSSQAARVAPNKGLKLGPVDAPKPANAPDPTGDPLKHGEYLVTLMHCNACHTPQTAKGPDLTRSFAGGGNQELPMVGTGVLHPSNITQDLATGIGKWSAQEIEDALKTMIRPNGKPILGAMMFYLGDWSRIEPADWKAIATYVKTIPAVKNAVPASTFVMNTAAK